MDNDERRPEDGTAKFSFLTLFLNLPGCLARNPRFVTTILGFLLLLYTLILQILSNHTTHPNNLLLVNATHYNSSLQRRQLQHALIQAIYTWGHRWLLRQDFDRRSPPSTTSRNFCFSDDALTVCNSTSSTNADY